MATIETLKKHDGTTVYPQTTFDAVQKSDGTTLTNEIDGKLTEPNTGLAVGKYFRVASIDSDGHAVLEAVDLPKATSTSLGVVSADPYRGLFMNDSGQIGVNKATNNNIDKRTETFRPIVPVNLVYAVNSVLCSTAESEALTDAQKANACSRLGSVKDNRKLLTTITLEEATSEIILNNELFENNLPCSFYLSINVPDWSENTVQTNILVYARSGNSSKGLICQISSNARTSGSTLTLLEAECIGGTAYMGNAIWGTASYNMNNRFGGIAPAITGLDNIQVRCENASSVFPQGTVFKLYGGM